jgi:hypothetical protein
MLDNLRLTKFMLFFLALLTFMGNESIFAQTQVGLDLSSGSVFSVSECPHAEINPFLAGGMGLLDVHIAMKIPRDFKPHKYHGLSRAWPQGLTLEAGTISGSEWAIVPGLIDRLNIQRWNLAMALREDSLWRIRGGEASEFLKDTSWLFTFEIPDDLAGQQLFFKATYIHPSLGTLSNPIPDGTSTFSRNRLTIVAPCSQKDRDRILGSRVQYAFCGGDNAKALALTDSLILQDWRDLGGLQAASCAAEVLGELKKSVEYLDLNYSANGRTDFYTKALSHEQEEEIYQRQRQEKTRMIELQQRQR